MKKEITNIYNNNQAIELEFLNKNLKIFKELNNQL